MKFEKFIMIIPVIRQACHLLYSHTEVFWLFAGAWNVCIALFFWNTLTKHDTELNNNINTRFLVAIFGYGYALVGCSSEYFWPIAALGALLKYLLFIDRFSKAKRKPNACLDIVLVGDMIWGVFFTVCLCSFAIHSCIGKGNYDFLLTDSASLQVCCAIVGVLLVLHITPLLFGYRV